MTETGREFETAALEAYLSAELEAEVLDINSLHDGLNLSLAVSTTNEDPAYVVRRPNKLRHTDAFNDLETEYEVLRRLQETRIPAPAPVLVCTDESVIGDSFLVMSHLDGVSVPLGTRLPEPYRTPEARTRVGAELVDTLAALHSVDVESFVELCDRTTALEQVEYNVERLEAATAVTGHELPTLWDVAEWLQRNAPSNQEMALLHGDFRPSNVLFEGVGRDDSPEITGVLDWETASLGDPLTELGYLLLRWRDDGDSTPSLDGIETRYPDSDAVSDLREINKNGLAPFTAEPGSPDRQELMTRYEQATGTAFENDRFYGAFAAFMLATVWEDLYRYQFENGLESEREPYVEYMSLLAESIVAGNLELSSG